MAMRQLSYMSDKSYETYKSYLENPETAANAAICKRRRLLRKTFKK